MLFRLLLLLENNKRLMLFFLSIVDMFCIKLFVIGFDIMYLILFGNIKVIILKVFLCSDCVVLLGLK